jgi:two-component system cell cycle response regulator
VARILVVDDNSVNLELMLYLLGAFGHEVQGHPDAIAGLEAARSGGFAIILTDMLMPSVDGYEFARRLRSEIDLGSTPLVAVTALAMPGDHDRIAQAGFDGYIPKPIEPRTFVAAVEAYLRREDGNGEHPRR